MYDQLIILIAIFPRLLRHKKMNRSSAAAAKILLYFVGLKARPAQAPDFVIIIDQWIG